MRTQMPFDEAYEIVDAFTTQRNRALCEAHLKGSGRPSDARLDEERRMVLASLGWSPEAFNKRCKEEIDRLLNILSADSN